MSEAFRGEFNQKVDGKARVSIPASFRRVLESGDPQATASTPARFVMVYGGERAFLECYTLTEMRRIEKRIARMKQGDRARRYLEAQLITRSLEVEVDPDGRIVLPPKGRDKIGLSADVLRDGAETVFAGALDRFHIWNRPDYDAQIAAQDAVAADILADGEDMLSLLPDDDTEDTEG